MIPTRIVQSLIATGLLSLPSLSHAQLPSPIKVQTDQLQRAEDRSKTVQGQQPQAPDVRMGTPTKKSTVLSLPNNESPSFLIRHIELVGDSNARFQFALRHAFKQLGLRTITLDNGQALVVTIVNNQATGHPAVLKEGVQLGANGINMIMSAAQNAIIERGYSTTRIMAEPQDLKKGTLKLTVIPGRVRHIQFDQSNADKTHVARAHSANAIPIHEGDILNLRDIEQGLENLKRVPTVEADIKIAPADQPNESDLIITWAQKTIPLRGNLTLDDSGSRSTGKDQGGVTLSVDNPLTLNDLFYINYSHSVAGYDHTHTVDENTGEWLDATKHGNTRSWNLSYSIPYGYWLTTFNASGYRYQQAVAGAYQNYTYSGHSRTQDLSLSKLLYRDAHRKTSAYIKGWSRYSDNFIDDAEIVIQRRKTAGFEFGLSHKEYIGSATLDLAAAYRRGTGAFNALHAPEELFDEGTSRMKIITADVGLALPFKFLNKDFSYNGSWHSQWNRTRLTGQDKIAIGGRNTVRGFDGNLSLAAERGWYSRNEWAMSYLNGHQVYLALDAGHVAGPSAKDLLGQTLIGTALGFRGQFHLGGDLAYDLFFGTPLKKPQGFKTARVTIGMNLSYAF